MSMSEAKLSSNLRSFSGLLGGSALVKQIGSETVRVCKEWLEGSGFHVFDVLCVVVFVLFETN